MYPRPPQTFSVANNYLDLLIFLPVSPEYRGYRVHHCLGVPLGSLSVVSRCGCCISLENVLSHNTHCPSTWEVEAQEVSAQSGLLGILSHKNKCKSLRARTANKTIGCGMGNTSPREMHKNYEPSFCISPCPKLWEMLQVSRRAKWLDGFTSLACHKPEKAPDHRPVGHLSKKMHRRRKKSTNVPHHQCQNTDCRN